MASVSRAQLKRIVRNRDNVDRGASVALAQEEGRPQAGGIRAPEAEPWTRAPKLGELLESTGVTRQAAQGPLGTVKLKTETVLGMLQRSVPERPVPAARYLITSAALRGEARRGHVRMHCEYTVEVLTEGWTSVWLLPDTAAVTDSSLRRLDSPEAAEQEGGDNDDPIASVGALQAGGHGLLINHAGKYDVRLTAMLPYSSPRESGLRIDTPPMSRCSLDFTVNDPEVQIKVDPSRDSTTQSSESATTVSCVLPPASFLSVQWTERVVLAVEEEEEEDEAEKPPLSVTCKQSTLYSIGEGVVNGWSSFAFKVMNGSVQTLEVLVDRRVRVLDCECEHLKRWEVLETVPPVEVGESKDRDQDQGDVPGDPANVDLGTRSLVRVWLDFGVEGKHELVVHTELEMPDTSAQVDLPSFQARGVNRESGTLAVEAITNVELRYLRGSALTMIDVSELGRRVTAQALNPLLLAYMFLDPAYELQLGVKRHEDIDVLVAVIDRAVLTATHTEEGRTLVKMELMMRNTQMQFLRVELPEEAEVWSAEVAHEVVKPAEDGHVTMLPLRKSNTGESAKFNVELTFMMVQPAMQPRGSLDVQLPVLSVPCNELIVHLYVPEDFVYGEFTGDMRETLGYLPGVDNVDQGFVPAVPRNFGNAGLFGDEEDEDDMMDDLGGEMEEIAFTANAIEEHLLQQTEQLNVMQDMPQAPQQMMRGARRPARRQERRRRRSLANDRNQRALSTAGLLPVKVETTTAGRHFAFRSILVSAEPRALHVDYRRVARARVARQGQGRRRCCRCVVS